MSKIRKSVGDIEVTAYTDGRGPISIYIEENGPANKGIELKLWGVEQLTDLQYALDRIQVALKPLVEAKKGD